MTETPFEPRKEAIKFDRNDLTPLVHIMIGSSVDIIVDGENMIFNSSALEEWRKNKSSLKIVLTPISLTQGTKTLEEVSQARSNGECLSGALSLFEFDFQWNYLEKGIMPTFVPGELDEYGQLKTFEVSLLQNDQKVALSNNPEKELPISKGFTNIVEYVGQENMAMKFRIKRQV